MVRRELAVQAVDLPSRTVHTIQGSILADGYYTHCRVYIDKNHNGQFDTVEPFDLSDEQGWYKVEAALPGDPVENLVEPSDVVRVSPDFPGSSDNCRSTLGNARIQHVGRSQSCMVSNYQMSALFRWKRRRSVEGTPRALGCRRCVWI